MRMEGLGVDQVRSVIWRRVMLPCARWYMWGKRAGI